MKKILLLTNIPSPYMVDYLNELGKHCELTAIFERASSSVRDNSWNTWDNKNFKSVILKGIELGGRDADTAICPQVINYINSSYDHIIVANPCTPTGIIALTYMKMKRIPYGFQSEGGFPGTGKGLKERFKKYLFSGGEFYFSTADLGDEYYLLYGAEEDKIKRYPFTSLHEKDILGEPVSIAQKEQIRKELGIPYKKMILSVGRILEVKGYDKLMEACVGLSDNVGIYIIGGAADDYHQSVKNKLDLNNVHFVDFQNKESLKKYYMAADVFAFNSRGDTWGLVINEAMAVGLPIISSNKCYAALAMMNNGLSGYIVDVDDVDTMHDRMEELLNSENKRYEMGKYNIEVSKYYTLENMGIVVESGL